MVPLLAASLVTLFVRLVMDLTRITALLAISERLSTISQEPAIALVTTT